MTDIFTVDDRLVWAFRGFELVGAVLCAIVTCQTIHDPACKSASPLLRDVRSGALLVTCSALVFSSVCFSIESMMAAMFFGAMNFVFNSMALKQRERYPPNSSKHIHALGGRRFAFRPSAFEALRRDQHHDAAE
jgi:hypothetical protein